MAFFLRRSRLLASLGESRPRSGARVLSYIVDFETHFPTLYLVPARTLSGSLCSPALVNGALVTLPYCSFCEGRTMALMGEGEVMLGTNNRNFLGRFGSPRAKAYLVNPEVAAASAIAGEIASVR